MIGCSGDTTPSRTSSGGSRSITFPKLSGMLANDCEAMVKENRPPLALIGVSSIASPPMVWNKDGPAFEMVIQAQAKELGRLA